MANVQSEAPDTYVTGKKVNSIDEFFDHTVDVTKISYINVIITIDGVDETYKYKLSKSSPHDILTCFGAPMYAAALAGPSYKFRFDSFNPVSIVYDGGKYSLYIPDPAVMGHAIDLDIKAIAVEDHSKTTDEFENLINSVTKDCVEKVRILGKFTWSDIPNTSISYNSERAVGVSKLNSGSPVAHIVCNYDSDHGRSIVVGTKNSSTLGFNYYYCPITDVLHVFCEEELPYISNVQFVRPQDNRAFITDLTYTFITDGTGSDITLDDLPIYAIVKTKNLVEVDSADVIEQGGSA